MTEAYEKVNQSVRTRILSIIEAEDDETYSGKDILEQLTSEGYKDHDVKWALESMIAKHDITYTLNRRLGKGVV